MPPALRPPALRGKTPGGLAQIISSRTQKGIGGYDLMDVRDQAFAFDYTGSGKLDHLFFYRPGSGMFSIVTYKQGRFVTVYKASDVKKSDDGLRPWLFQQFSNLRGFAIDYGSQGRLDHVAFYAPGYQSFIAKRHPRDRYDYDWQPFGAPENLSDPNDKAFAFDYSGNGCLDHVVAYRPGTGKIWILGLGPDGFHWEDKWKSENGIEGFDLSDPKDLGLAFDYEHRGRLDHLLFYRPGKGILCIIKKDGNRFRLVYDTRNTKWGIADSQLDRIIAFDYTNSSKPGYYYHDHLVCYGPGTGKVFLIRRKPDDGNFEEFFVSSTGGIGTYDLKGATDQILAFDYKEDVSSKIAAPSGGSAAPNSGPSELFLFRPGSGLAFIVQSIVKTRRSERFAPAYWYSGLPEPLREPRRADLSALASAPEASGDPAGYARSDGVNSVVYRGENNHIYELYLPKGGSWICAKLSEGIGAPAASGNPAGYVRSDGTNMVVYRGTNNHIYALYLEGSWKCAKLSESTGAPEASAKVPALPRLQETRPVTLVQMLCTVGQTTTSTRCTWKAARGSVPSLAKVPALLPPRETRLVTFAQMERIWLCTVGQTTTSTRCTYLKVARGLTPTLPKLLPALPALPPPRETRLVALVQIERIRLCTAGQTTTSTRCTWKVTCGITPTLPTLPEEKTLPALPPPRETRLVTLIQMERIRLCTVGKTSTSTSCTSQVTRGVTTTLPYLAPLP